MSSPRATRVNPSLGDNAARLGYAGLWIVVIAGVSVFDPKSGAVLALITVIAILGYAQQTKTGIFGEWK